MGTFGVLLNGGGRICQWCGIAYTLGVLFPFLGIVGLILSAQELYVKDDGPADDRKWRAILVLSVMTIIAGIALLTQFQHP